jgi:hypothetical protein
VEALRETPLEKAGRVKQERGGRIDPGWLDNYPNITRGQAIQVFCRECMGYTKHRGDGKNSLGWKLTGGLVRECTDPECPLYKFRPGAKKGPRLVENTP